MRKGMQAESFSHVLNGMHIICVFLFSLLVVLFLSSCRSSEVLEKAVAESYESYDIVGLEAEPSESENVKEESENDVVEEPVENDVEEEDIDNSSDDINEFSDKDISEPTDEVIIEGTEPIVEEVEVPQIVYTYSDADKTVYATLNLNVRSGPSTDFDIIGTFTNNSEIYVTGICNETGWYRVDYNGSVGYCDANYTADNIVTTTTDNSDNNTINNDNSANTENSNNVAIGNGIVSAGDSGASSYYVGLVQNAFYSLPQWVQNAFVNNGWHIYMRSGSWWYEYGWSMQLKGLTYYGNKAIYLSARDDSANYHTLAHEMGHFVDCMYGFPSNSSNFSGIYNSEYRQFCNYYNYSNGYPGVEELFAEGLYHYWSDPGTLASVASQTYNYINGIFG